MVGLANSLCSKSFSGRFSKVFCNHNYISLDYLSSADFIVSNTLLIKKKENFFKFLKHLYIDSEILCFTCTDRPANVRSKQNIHNAAKEHYPSTGHQEQKSKKGTGQIKFSAVTIKLISQSFLCK